MSEPIIEMANPNSGENIEIEMEIQANDAVSAAKAEAYAVGERNGVPVTEGDPAYHNNAKYYTEMAQHLGNLTVDATTGAAGSEAQATVTTIEGNPHIDFTIPRGDKGDTGNTGATPNISIGTVTDLPAGSTPTATMTGTAENPVLNLGLVHGQSGNETIDDTAGIGDTDLVFSADKVTRELMKRTEEIIPMFGSLSGNKTTDNEPYLFRKTGGDGIREQETLVGGTVAWNQKVQPTYASATQHGLTFTKNADNSITINGTATNTENGNFTVCTIQRENGHKYLMQGCPANGSSNTYYFGIGGTLVDTGNGGIYAAQNSNQGYIRFDYRKGAVFNNVKFVPQCFDLTQMFGSTVADAIYAMETATPGSGIAWFRSLFPKDYYEYDAGSLKSVQCEGKKTVGFNLWDEEWKLGTYNSNTGEHVSSYTDRICSKNMMPAIPNQTYYFKTANGVINGNIYYYTKDKEFINYDSSKGNNVFTTPANCSFMHFSFGPNYGITYNHDICINISDPAKNGTYEPYTPHTYPFDSDLILRGIPKWDSTSGKMYYDGDQYKADGTVVRRYGIVDLGTLTYSYSSNGYFYTDGIKTTVKAPSSSTVVPNVIARDYNACSVSDFGNVDKVIAIVESTDDSGKGRMRVKDSSKGTDPAAFKTAMSGVYLVYELATPTTETADPFAEVQICDPAGTEEYIDTRDVAVPVGHETAYYQSMRSYVDNMMLLMNLIITANRETSMTATKAYTAGDMLIVNGKLYKASTSIANGSTLTVGTNVTVTTVANEIAALA